METVIHSMKRAAAFGVFLAAGLVLAGPLDAAPRINDFPTQARVEYVLACMSNVTSDYIHMQQCSCAVDTIAAHLTYDQFVDAQTIRSVQQSFNAHADVYRNLDIAKEPLDKFYRAEALAELKCF